MMVEIRIIIFALLLVWRNIYLSFLPLQDASYAKMLMENDAEPKKSLDVVWVGGCCLGHQQQVDNKDEEEEAAAQCT